MNRRPAVFFDRDGVINYDHGSLYRPEDFVWMDGAVEAIRYFNQAGTLVFVITNQSGIARGYYQEADLWKLHAWINEELANHDAHIDAFYYCPHYPETENPLYNRVCDCRKPQPGMIKQALRQWPILMEESFMVGDKPSDVECAQNAGIPGYLFPGGNLFDFLKQVGCVKQ